MSSTDNFYSSSHGPHGTIQWHGTTIIGVKKGGKTVIAGDGQVSMGNTVMKPNARKVRRIGSDTHPVIAGFAGATADVAVVQPQDQAVRTVQVGAAGLHGPRH